MSVYQEQKATKPRIEDIINQSLNGDRKQAALDFVAYIKSLKMTPRWASANSWDVKYKGRGVCKIQAGGGTWLIRPSFNYIYDDALFAFLADEKLQEPIWSNINRCRGCGKNPQDCMKKSVTVMGKEFKGVCSCVLFQFHNPDAAAIDCAKKLVEYRRATIVNPPETLAAGQI